MNEPSRLRWTLRRWLYWFRHWIMQTRGQCDHPDCTWAVTWRDDGHVEGPRKGCARHFTVLNPPTAGACIVWSEDQFERASSADDWAGEPLFRYSNGMLRVAPPGADYDEGLERWAEKMRAAGAYGFQVEVPDPPRLIETVGAKAPEPEPLARYPDWSTVVTDDGKRAALCPTPSDEAYAASFEPERCPCHACRCGAADVARLALEVFGPVEDGLLRDVPLEKAEALDAFACALRAYAPGPFTSSLINTSGVEVSPCPACDDGTPTVTEWEAGDPLRFCLHCGRLRKAREAAGGDTDFDRGYANGYRTGTKAANAKHAAAHPEIAQLKAQLIAHRITYECEDGRHCWGCGMLMTDLAHLEAKYCPHRGIRASKRSEPVSRSPKSD